MVSKCPSQMSGPRSGLVGLEGLVGRGGGGGPPDLLPVEDLGVKHTIKTCNLCNKFGPEYVS